MIINGGNCLKYISLLISVKKLFVYKLIFFIKQNFENVKIF